MSSTYFLEEIEFEYYLENSNEERYDVIGQYAYDFFDLNVKGMLKKFDDYEEFWDICSRLVIKSIDEEKIKEKDFSIDYLKSIAFENELDTLDGYKELFECDDEDGELRLFLLKLIFVDELKMFIKSWYKRREEYMKEEDNK